MCPWKSNGRKSNKTNKLVYAKGYKTVEEVLLARVDREDSSEEVTLIKSLRMKTNIEQKKTWVGGWSVRGRSRRVNQSVDQINSGYALGNWELLEFLCCTIWSADPLQNAHL